MQQGKSSGSKFIDQEKDHYNKQASNMLNNTSPMELYKNYDFSWKNKNPVSQAHQKWFDLFQNVTKDNFSILDYCCGYGLHTVKLRELKPNSNYIGIDISKESLEIGKAVSKEVFQTNLPQFEVQDAHKTTFKDNQFDIVCNFGSLSSLKFYDSISEVKRILKPEGYFISIETFGHNPLVNLKRKLNNLKGSRTAWATNNILQNKELKYIKKEFSEFKVYHYGFFTLLSSFLPKRILEKADYWLFKLFPFLKRYSFKVVFIAKN